MSDPLDKARSLEAIASNQRCINYWMRKSGMHWSSEGAEAIVKIKQGIFSYTLRVAISK